MNTTTSRQRGKCADTYGHWPETTPKDGSCKDSSDPLQGYLAHKKRLPVGAYSSPMPRELW